MLSQLSKEDSNTDILNVYKFFINQILFINSNHFDYYYNKCLDIINKKTEYLSYIEQIFLTFDTGILSLKMNKPFQIQVGKRFFDGENELDLNYIDIKNESNQIKELLTLSTFIIDSLKNGKVLIIDNFSNFHTFWIETLVKFFYDKKINSNNSQLIFSTHDSSLIETYLFDKDQITLIDKDYYGKTEINVISDFKGLKTDVPIGYWYMSGKFRAVPRISDYINFKF